MSRRDYSVPQLHQENVLSLREFGDREGLTLAQVKYCCLHGLILGARKDARSKRWAIYPPAKLLRRPEPLRTSAEPAAQQLAANPTEAREGHAVGGIPEGGRFAHPAASSAPEGQPRPPAGPKPGCVAVKPWAFAAPEVRESCRALRAAARPAGALHLSLTDAELLHLHSALSQDRSRTRKAIGKGLCEVGDLRASDSVWEKLQALYFGRGRPA